MSNLAKRAAMAIVYQRERGRCFWCERVVERRCRVPLPPHAATLDHIIPRSRGGCDQTANLVLACFSCNNARGDMEAEQYLALVRGLAAPTREMSA